LLYPGESESPFSVKVEILIPDENKPCCYLLYKRKDQINPEQGNYTKEVKSFLKEMSASGGELPCNYCSAVLRAYEEIVGKTLSSSKDLKELQSAEKLLKEQVGEETKKSEVNEELKREVINLAATTREAERLIVKFNANIKSNPVLK